MGHPTSKSAKIPHPRGVSRGIFCELFHKITTRKYHENIYLCLIRCLLIRVLMFRCFYVSTSTQEATSVLFCVGLKNIYNELNKYDENWRKLPRDLQKSHEPWWSLWYFCVEKHHAKLDFFRKSHPTRWDFEIPRIRSHTWGNL